MFFLNSELQEKIFMILPLGFCKKGEENEVCKLQKSLYGFKQSPRAWLDGFSNVIKREGYSEEQSNHTMFYKQKN